jgi:hypothetical protein
VSECCTWVRKIRHILRTLDLNMEYRGVSSFVGNVSFAMFDVHFVPNIVSFYFSGEFILTDERFSVLDI